MAKLNKTLADKGAGLAAISADPPDASMKFAKEADIAYPLLSDADLRVALDYGVAMKGEDIAVPSVFIVLPDRRIFWKHVGESVMDRPSDQDLIAKIDQAIAASTAKGKAP